MDDLISRQAAIDAMTNTLWHYPNECYRNLNEYEFAKGLAELGLKSVPPVQPSFPQRHENDYIAEVSKMDCVSRQVVKDALVERTILEWEQLKTCYPMLEAVDEVPSSQPEQRWIPCGERLPKEGEVVLITNEKGNVKHGQYRGCYPSDKVDWWWWKKNTTEKVIAWMPLPEPWKGEEE